MIGGFAITPFPAHIVDSSILSAFGLWLAGLAVILGIATTAGAQDGSPEVRPAWAAAKRLHDLTPHPRLFVSQAQLDRMVAGRGDAFTELYAQVAAAADAGLRETDNPLSDFSMFDRGFLIQGRLTSLAIQWHRTKDRRYLDAAVTTIERMKDWLEPLDEYSLEHGQYIAAIAVTYDLLHNDLTPAQRQALVAFARDHCIRPYLRLTGRGGRLDVDGQRGSWWQDIVSNWNPVCNSGPGMLALTLYEDLDEAQTVLDRVDESLDRIIDDLQMTGGGWVEGLGYWNWTIHYMSLFYISYERATGQRHAGFRSPGFRQSLTFVDFFVPYDEACGFGDNQHGDISDSLLAAAEHLGDEPLLQQLLRYRLRYEQAQQRKRLARSEGHGAGEGASDADAERGERSVDIGYGVPQQLLISPDPLAAGTALEPGGPLLQVYPKQGWAALADRWPLPNVYAAARGGQLGGPHTHHDLLSWHGVVGQERMILSQWKADYLQSSWARRAHEIYERNHASKNGLIIAGLGPGVRPGQGPVQAQPATYHLPTGPMLRLDASQSYWTTRANPKLVVRAFLILGNDGLLVLDRMVAPAGHPVEARAYTEKRATFAERDVLLEGDFETARMTFASDRPAVLREAVALLTNASADPPTMMRWQTVRSEPAVTMASLLTRGSDPVRLAIESSDAAIVVTAEGREWSHRIELTPALEPIARP